LKRALKWTGFGLGILALVALLLAAIYHDRITRLLAVNSLFAEENIVANFSGMGNMFFSAPIENTGDVEPWYENPKPLISSFSHDGKTEDTIAFLTETATTSLLVIHNNEIVFEGYYLGTGPDDLRISWSVAKSFLSAVFGIAVEEGKIRSLDDKLTDYVDALKGSAYEGVTIRNALNMSTGVKFNEDYLDFNSDINKMGRVLALGGSMDGFAAGLKERDRQPGVARKYTSIDTHVLAMVLEAATGKTLVQLMGEQIVSPIGFSKAPYYLTDGDGTAFALGGLNLTTRDYARFGEMILEGGLWQGTRIVPEAWINESIRPSAPRPEAGEDNFQYGYQWWIPPDAIPGEVMARGIYDQYIYINRKANTVIVKTSANRHFKDEGMSERTVAFFRAVATSY
jgi:CubicO group peptidase (beta-lactamase class C family)